ncbi:nucleotidyltransferase-like protein [Chitinophaga skermanii]|uniref:Nucleotidyltransferase-like protein n=1 Tax=Chitinophaga skermanii TaxID=331697 RepID=A0A327R4S2_9BACT|nr:nucleotidyltransferase domain-containing protein [Chitinophaga skermanii]RAJ08887.1 nucleotidyltransferase-like protein [Chitinophaga skermanii]
MLSTIDIEKIVARLVEELNPEKIIVFGSYAKGTAKATSDLDLYIIQQTRVPMRQRTMQILPMLQHYYVKIDAHVFTPAEVQADRNQRYSFANCVMRTGKVLYEKAVVESIC